MINDRNYPFAISALNDARHLLDMGARTVYLLDSQTRGLLVYVEDLKAENQKLEESLALYRKFYEEMMTAGLKEIP